MDRSSPTPAAGAPSYWCYSCERFVSAAGGAEGDAEVVCPGCDGGFLEEMDAPPPPPRRAPAPSAYLRRRGNADLSTGAAPLHGMDLRHRRSRRGAASRDRSSPYNPVIVLRRSTGAVPAAQVEEAPAGGATSSSFELYYDDGAGSGLRPLPDSMSDFLMGSGFERLLDQLAQIEAGTGLGEREPFIAAGNNSTLVSQHVCVLRARTFNQCPSLVLEVGVELCFHPRVEESEHKLGIAR